MVDAIVHTAGVTSRVALALTPTEIEGRHLRVLMLICLDFSVTAVPPLSWLKFRSHRWISQA